MKRNEMIDKMCDFLKNHPDYGFIHDKGLTEEDVKIIMGGLLILIEQDMDPRPYQERIGMGYVDEFGEELTIDEWVQGWEAEK